MLRRFISPQCLKTKYMFMSREKCRKNYNIKMGVSTFNYGKFKYLGKNPNKLQLLS